jgi:hypothetical protein
MKGVRVSGQATLESTTPPAPVPGRRSARGTRLTGMVTGAVLAIVAAGALAGWFPRSSDEEASVSAAKVPLAWQRPAVSKDGLIERSGVRLTQVAVSGGGGLVDLRFQVVDPDKAASVHDEQTPPAIVDEETGLLVNRLLMNHAHSGKFKPAQTYYLVFENPGNWIHRGSTVTIVLGDAQVEHVRVS